MLFRSAFLIGQGQTAGILRNLCFQVSLDAPKAWEWITRELSSLFGVSLRQPEFISERSEIRLVYDQGKTELDISSAGRGFQQTLLLLTHLAANPGAILLLDEPDAHLEVLRQRQVFNLISDAAAASGGISTTSAGAGCGALKASVFTCAVGTSSSSSAAWAAFIIALGPQT